MKKVLNKNWQHYTNSWHNFTPPWRPSLFEINQIKKFLKSKFNEKNSKKALILGCTPEFRDLLHQLKFPVTCLDINKEMFLGMGRLMKTNPQRDKLIQGNWLDKPLIKNYFDVVLSDEALDNIAYGDYKKFHQNVTTFLKPKGYYIYNCYYLVKRNLLPKELRAGQIKDLLKFYEKNPNWFKKFEHKEIIYQMFINNKAYKSYLRQKDWQLNFGWYEKLLAKYLKNKIINQKMYQALSLGLGKNSLFTQTYQKNYEKIFKRFFKILKVYSDPTYQFKNKSLYIMQVK